MLYKWLPRVCVCSCECVNSLSLPVTHWTVKYKFLLSWLRSRPPSSLGLNCVCPSECASVSCVVTSNVRKRPLEYHQAKAALESHKVLIPLRMGLDCLCSAFQMTFCCSDNVAWKLTPWRAVLHRLSSSFAVNTSHKVQTKRLAKCKKHLQNQNKGRWIDQVKLQSGQLASLDVLSSAW